MITYTYGGVCEELIVASDYLPYDSDEPPPTKEVRDIIEHFQSRKKQLIVGYDANAHHTLCSSTGTNPIGDSLMEFLVSSNLNILNRGNEPTFVVHSRKEVIVTVPFPFYTLHSYADFDRTVNSFLRLCDTVITGTTGDCSFEASPFLKLTTQPALFTNCLFVQE
jgi:hypothetical protein